jgi:competence protein ComEC
MQACTKLATRTVRAISMCILGLCFLSGAFAADALTANILSVGHGDAIFVEFPSGSTMLVDGGNVSAGDSVVSYIKRSGCSKIDYLVLTHTHNDHIGGLLAVLDSFVVAKVWMSAYYEETPLYLEFKSRLEAGHIPVTIVARDDTFNIGDVAIVIYNPPAESTIQQLEGANGASIVMHLQYGNTSILLAADIDSDRDRDMVRLYGDRLRSTVLKCAHHGSDISNSEEFLKTVRPQIAVVSTGPSQYNYPSQATMERIETLVPRVYRTDRDGTIVITLDGKNATVETR